MPDQPFRLGYRPALDGLRGIAIISVLAFHSQGFSLVGGFVGVDLFFVLSGFLITTLLIQERLQYGRVDLKAFYIRRALRLLPAMLAVLLALWIATITMSNRFTTGPALMAKVTIVTLAYLPNWYLALDMGYWPSVFGHVWSLAIEEQFYLVWPIILIGCLATRRPTRVGVFVALGLGLAVTLWRVYLTVEGAPFHRRYFATDTRSDGLFIGCAVGLLVCRFGLAHRSARWIAGVAGFATFVTMLFEVNNVTPFMYLCGWTVVGIASAAMILGSLDAPGPVRVLLEFTPLVGLGRISYGLYLWHHLVYFALMRVPQLETAPRWVMGTAEFGLTLIVAIASYYIVERPALKLKSRFGPRLKRGQLAGLS